MRLVCSSPTNRTPRTRVGAWLLVASAIGACGCQLPATALPGGAHSPAAHAARPPLESALLEADNPLILEPSPAAQAVRASPATRLNLVLTVLHVQVPRDASDDAATLWNHLREDVFDSGTALRLRQNGLRVGVGRAQWWEPVRAALDAIPGVRSLPLTPLRVPPQYPVAFELDTAPHEQTLFYVADDGVLTGETWPASRNVLRVSYDFDLADSDRVRLAVVPEVRQRLRGWRWVRSEAGLTQEPNYAGRAFGAAAFLAELEPGEFLLVAPGERADVYGLVGRQFLVQQQEGREYDSYVFLRADVNHVAQRY